MLLKKGRLTINLNNKIQIAAYLKSGWIEVKKEVETEGKTSEKEKKSNKK